MARVRTNLVKMGILLLLGSNILHAGEYIVKKGDSLKSIIHTLGYSSIEEANIKSVPSGNFNMIFPGDVIMYGDSQKTSHQNSVGRYIQKQRKFKHTDNVGNFCFKDNSSIHYRATQRCK